MLDDLELRLILNPDDVDLLFDRAFALEALGRTDEAKGAYHGLLQRDASHARALNNLARLLHREGARRPARVLLERLLRVDPRSAMGHANLGIILMELDDFAPARKHLEEALRLDEDLALAHIGLARIFAIEGDDAASLQHQRAAFGEGALGVSPPQRGPNLLLLTSEEQLGAISGDWLADATFSMTTLIVERFADSSLPPHHAIFNTISDADRNARALELARAIVARSGAPVVNAPEAVLGSARTALSERLGNLDDVVAPRVLALPRSEVVSQALGWPVLLRSPGFHSGQHFIGVDEPASLDDALGSLPGEVLLAIEPLASRSPDGKFRKYRVMIVDGALYPLHVAISDHWKVHFFSAEMATHPERRAEDHAFLAQMEAVVGARGMRALEAIAARLQLDYAGIDFALDAQGRVLVFEANATMTVPAPPRGESWDYRRAPVKRILDATRRMLLKRARTGGWR